MQQDDGWRATDLTRPYDAVVIGSGAGGAPLALRLGQRGLRVLVVEQGDFLRVERGGEGEPVGRFITDVMGSRDAPLSIVGGRTKFYGAALYRMRESDFSAVEHETGTSPAWPITYAELEPYYEQAELLYRVHGASEGDPSEPPRANPYPHPPLPHGGIVAEMVQRLTRSGTPVAPVPSGLDYGPGGSCVLCPTCDAHLCTRDAKMDAETASMRPALATGNVHLATQTECLRILTDGAGGRATGVLLRRQGEEYVVRAGVVAVCGGLPGSALMLRRSRTDRHPEGLGNAGGALGRYLGGHSVGMIFPFTGLRPVPAFYTKTFAINAYYEGGPGSPHPLGVVQVAGQMPFWEEASRLVRPVARLVGRHSLMCFYMSEALPSQEAGLRFDGDRLAGRVEPRHNLQAFGRLRDLAVEAFRRAGYPSLARKRPPYLWHEVGTVRFGTDPASSVLDPDCQVHGIKGLYVVDASTLPSAGAVNTALTIIALALRAGDHIAGAAAPGQLAQEPVRPGRRVETVR
ncbi:GMC oxidoreductase [Roseicella sp. DB1501]|uniref:GMC oxidoreductase n=1 Tax=Roseicella sp. DB1501 TaxID=2730925 RepID=UPI0014932028|nr:GMC family oxidoreductase [Roseicella sp. DB1501]NOG74155.1 GMC family oxidoreductase [Roseicella sp. DB1501]